MLNRNDPESLQEVLKKLIEKFSWEEKSALAEIKSNWASIVGEKFKQVSTPERLSDGVLYVVVNSSVWRAEMFYRREQIVKKINDLQGKNVVKELLIQ